MAPTIVIILISMALSASTAVTLTATAAAMPSARPFHSSNGSAPMHAQPPTRRRRICTWPRQALQHVTTAPARLATAARKPEERSWRRWAKTSVVASLWTLGMAGSAVMVGGARCQSAVRFRPFPGARITRPEQRSEGSVLSETISLYALAHILPSPPPRRPFQSGLRWAPPLHLYARKRVMSANARGQ